MNLRIRQEDFNGNQYNIFGGLDPENKKRKKVKLEFSESEPIKNTDVPPESAPESKPEEVGEEIEGNYLEEEIGEPIWIDRSEDNYPDDLEPVDKNGKSKEDIFEIFKKDIGLLEQDYITFDKKENEWRIKGMKPNEWKKLEDDLDQQWKHGRNG